jgi:hypothetical protein
MPNRSTTHCALVNFRLFRRRDSAGALLGGPGARAGGQAGGRALCPFPRWLVPGKGGTALSPSLSQANGTSRSKEARWYELAGRGGDQEFVCPSGHEPKSMAFRPSAISDGLVAGLKESGQVRLGTACPTGDHRRSLDARRARSRDGSPIARPGLRLQGKGSREAV